MNILNKVNSSDDIKSLNKEELKPLCKEIREYLVSCISETGGHLASNLGAVELTVALHRVYDTSKDRLVFDVGHQSYTHKIITGRRDALKGIRQHGGISGFPKPYESDDDAFIAGHASDSISVALGMARARTLQKQDYDVVAVIGDGALTGGLAYEGLANVGGSNEPIVIILNDNGMSINGNVGGIAKVLSKERIRPSYLKFKRWYRSVVGNVPELYNTSHKIKETIKKRILPTNIFDAMGIYYLGPVNGHDIEQMETVIRWAKDMRVPVLVHVLTKKGKGKRYSEEHPEKYHGVGKFNPSTGELPDSKPSFSSAFGNKLCELAERNDKIVAISAAMCDGTGLRPFEDKFPDRFYDVGIAEQHAVSMAAGMAKQGLIPVFAVYSSFLQRAYDMLIHDIALLNLHVVFCVDRAGLVGNDGETHHGVFDVDYLGSVPDMTILCPSNFAELEIMLEKAIFEIDGPVAVRYPRGGEGTYTGVCTDPVIREGGDITIAAYGTMINTAIKTADILESKGVLAEVIKIGCIKPMNAEPVLKSVKKTGKLLVTEDVCEIGCVGRAIMAVAEKAGVPLKAVELCNLGDGIVAHGTVDELMNDCALDAESLSKRALKLIRGEL